MLSHTRLHGAHPDAATALAALGVSLWEKYQLQLAFAVGSVGQLLLVRFGEAARAIGPKAKAPFLGHIYPLRKPLRDCYVLEIAALDEALQLGEIASANASVHIERALKLMLACPSAA